MLRNTLLVVGAVAPFSLAGLFVQSAVEPASPNATVAVMSCCSAAPAAAQSQAIDAQTNTESLKGLGYVGAPAQAGATGDATVKGKIKFEGEAPKREAIDMKSDGVCVKAHSAEVLKEDVVVGKDGALKNVFVYVKKGIEGKYDAPATTAVLDQHGCVYAPHVFGVVAGQKISIKNSDGTTHNIHTYGKKNRVINQGQPSGSPELSVEWKVAEMSLWIKCDMHSWMSSVCHVMKHPFFAVSGDDGSFEIKNLPAGKYTIAALHETLGEQTVDIEVAAKDSKDANFSFKK
jgi:plastocyanin